MKRAGHDLPATYRETAEGGLALLVASWGVSMTFPRGFDIDHILQGTTKGPVEAPALWAALPAWGHPCGQRRWPGQLGRLR
jgi:hypothetical protein